MRAKGLRSSDDIKSIAASISFSRGWKAHNDTPKIPGRPCPYSLETRRMCHGDSPEDRRDLVETYGDGGTACIMAPWPSPRKSLDENDAKTTCGQMALMGHVPFIGVWHFRVKMHEEPSFAADRGISRAEVRAMLEAFGQEAAYLVRYDGAESVEVGHL